MSSRTQSSRGGGLLFGAAGGLLLASGGLLAGYFVHVRSAAAERGAPLAGEPAVAGSGDPTVQGSPDDAAVRKAAEAFLDRPVTVHVGDAAFATTWRQLGVVVDPTAVVGEAGRFASAGRRPDATAYQTGPAGGVVPVTVDADAGLAAMVSVKDRYDHAPVNAKLDLDARALVAEQAGYGVHAYASLAAIADAARSGASEVSLVAGQVSPDVTRESLGNIDITHVMATFKTTFSVADKDRNHNLKLAASHLNGYVLLPGKDFSFNEVVGDRTEKEGYRVAHVITAGEMVDGLAGGTCQISTTLHGAAFFSGLDILDTTPHSRPSVYVPMGLDATVVYPTTDLKLRNPYDFPVVIHYVVVHGDATVEILGKGRPYDEIAFEREVKKETPFTTVTREDDTMPVGSSTTDQPGFPGYQVVRYRKFYKDGQVVRTDKWNLTYKPVTEYVRMGINPDPNLPVPVQVDAHMPKPPHGNSYRQAQ